MDRISDLVKGYDGQNPFSDSQARNFSDSKITNEFYPISNYWSLFNDQHEILMGTRGSGKTYLLKMMRYSMLKRIQGPQAEQLISEKRFLALYIPMYLEFVTHLTNSDSSEGRQIQLFQFAFNCLLAQSLLIELSAILNEEPNKLERAKTNLALANDLNDMWFNEGADDISDLFSLTLKIKKLFYNFDVKTSDIDLVPPVFKRQIGASLLTVKELIAKNLNFQEEPTWIVCIDEAEFLTEPLQKCINSVFRSDSNRIALKVATLPYYHRTLETLDSSISVSAGNDFNYRVVDMKYDSIDFRNLTNRLCSHRIKTRFDPDTQIERLEDFVGVLGRDDLIDYYREEVGDTESTHDYLEKEIIGELSDQRKSGVKSYSNPRKTIYDKFAPVFFTRRMYKLSKMGNTKPGWYAGSSMIRKISQGNPRAFIQIMNKLFEKARKSELTSKAQHGVIFDYVHSFCESTQALERYGPSVYKELDKIALILKDQVHGQHLISAGCSFILKFDRDGFFLQAKQWLQLAIAYSRLIVDEDTLKNGLKKDTKYLLANTYAAKYWLPMRADVSPKIIKIDDDQVYTYTVKTVTSSNQQLSIFKEEGFE